MGLKYGKQLALASNAIMNAGLSGINTFVGKPGAIVCFSQRGTRATVRTSGSSSNYSRKTTQRSSSVSDRQKAEDARRNRMRQYGTAKPQTRQGPQTAYDDVKRQFGEVASEVKRLKNSISLPSKPTIGSSGGDVFSKFRRKKRFSFGKKILIVIIAILVVNFLIFFGMKK